MPTSPPVKEWVVTFDENGDVINTRDVSDPVNSPPRQRIIAVRATTMVKAAKAALALYSLSK